jgi:chromosome segregation ATPase
MSNFVPFNATGDNNQFITSAAQSVEKMVEKVSRAERDLNRRLQELRRAEAQAIAKINELREAEDRVADLTAILEQQTAAVHGHRDALTQQAADIEKHAHTIHLTAQSAHDSLSALVPQLSGDLQDTVNRIEDVLGDRIENRMAELGNRIEMLLTKRVDEITASLKSTVESLEDRLTTLDSSVDSIVELIRTRVTDELHQLGEEYIGLARDRAHRDAEAFMRPFQQRLAEVKTQINEQMRLSIDQYRTRAAEALRATTDLRLSDHREAA